MFTDFFPRMWELMTKYSKNLFAGFGNTVLIAFCAFLIGLFIGCLVVTIKLIPKKHNSYLLRFLDMLANMYLAIFRGTPVVVQLLFSYFAILLPIGMPPLLVAIIIFGLNSGAYVSEIMRGGILAIDKGQLEASRSLGMNYGQSMTKIILPQGIKNSIPNLANEFITLLKETSVAGFIGAIDLTKAIQLILASKPYVAAGYFLLGLIYFIVIYISTKLIQLLERRLRQSDNR